MVGEISSGDLCTVAVLAAGDIVLCRVHGNQYLHLVKAIQGERFQIGNNRGGINGWITRRQIFGRLLAVEPGRARAGSPSRLAAHREASGASPRRG
jgi:hypothetical protein